MKARVLVPLDGSSLGEHALSCAVTLSRALSAELVLFHAISDPQPARRHLKRALQEEDDLGKRLETHAEEYLRQVADLVQQADLHVQTVVQRGTAAEAIVDYAEHMGIQQIVMATHGYSGIKRWTHGSVAERVLQSASVPVLMVPARQEDTAVMRGRMQCRRILVPLDGSLTAEQVLSPTRILAQALGSQVFLFQVAFDQQPSLFRDNGLFLPLASEFAEEEQAALTYLEGVAASLREARIPTSIATDIGPVADTIIDYAAANDIDLIAMCTHGLTGLARWAFGSVADKILRAGRLPILLVRAQ